MQLKNKIMSSLVVAAGVLVASILFPIVPCRTTPNVPNPVYKWGFCNLNPDTVQSTFSLKQYFGYTTSMTTTYFLILLITFAAAMIIFHFVARKKKD